MQGCVFPLRFLGIGGIVGCMGAESHNLTGKLLLAHPTLRDPNFRRTIVFLVSHDPLAGAFGFIINRPTEQRFSELALEQPGDLEVDAPLYVGGPVGTNRVVLARLEWDALRGQTEFTHTLPMEAAETASGENQTENLAIIGYAGWSMGQLEAEIEENSWVVLAPMSDLRRADATTWKKLIAGVHPSLRLLAELPDDPSLN